MFQAHKFLPARPDLADRIRRTRSPRAALEEATRLRRVQRRDWYDVNIAMMDVVLERKFTQDARLKALLLDTGERELVEDSPVGGLRMTFGFVLMLPRSTRSGDVARTDMGGTSLAKRSCGSETSYADERAGVDSDEGHRQWLYWCPW